jgi:hypothetical protein
LENLWWRRGAFIFFKQQELYFTSHLWEDKK